MRILVKGLGEEGGGCLEVSEGLITDYREEKGKERKDPRGYNVPMAEFILERVRLEKGPGYNCQSGFQCVLNGEYHFLSQKIRESEIRELFKSKAREESIEEEVSDYYDEIGEQPPPYLVETSEERVMRN